MDTFWTLSKVGGNPWENRAVGVVNDALIPAKHCHAFRTRAELAQDEDVFMIVSDEEGDDGSDWEVVEFAGDDEEIIVPGPSDNVRGVFVSVIGEKQRYPLMDWLRGLQSGGNVAEREAADEMLETYTLMRSGGR